MPAPQQRQAGCLRYGGGLAGCRRYEEGRGKKGERWDGGAAQRWLALPVRRGIRKMTCRLLVGGAGGVSMCPRVLLALLLLDAAR